MKKYLLVGAVLLACSANALAGHAGSAGAKVSRIMIHKAEPLPVLMFSTAAHLEKPVCNGAPALEWAVKMDDFGKYVYSLVLSAQAQGKNVVVNGLHRCEDWGDRESVVHITIVD